MLAGSYCFSILHLSKSYEIMVTALGQTEIEVVYNPSALLNIFGSTLNNETTRKVFKVKGVYTQGKGANYNGFYYDTLRDETSDACMTLVVPGLIRSQLSPNQTIECIAHLGKKVQLNGGRIDLQLNIVDLLSKSSSNYTETQLKAFEILERKAATGLKDVDNFIKSKITKGDTITINIIIGKSAIIQEDIKHQLKEAIGYYKIYFRPINLTSTKEIIENLHFYNGKTDIIAIARGGGENLEIFENPDIAEVALSLSTHFITAIGHAANVPLLQKIADKHFITPTALGQYFNEIYNNTVAELQHSKAKMVDDITKHLEAGYRKEIENLHHSVLTIEKTKQSEVSVLASQLQAVKDEKAAYNNRIQDLERQVEKAKGVSMSTILLIIAALLIGLLIGRMIM